MRLAFDDYVLDAARRELRRSGDLVAIEPQVLELLLHFVQNPDRVITRDELLEAVWDGRVVSESAIANRVNAARRAIGDTGYDQRLIRTVPRKGYRFIAAVEELGVHASPPTVPENPFRRRSITPGFFVALASALLGPAVAAFLLRPTPGPPLRPVVPADAGRAPITAQADDLRLTSRLPLPALSNGADQLRPPVAIATELQLGGTFLAAPSRRGPAHLKRAAAGAQSEFTKQDARQLLAPSAAGIAPMVPIVAAIRPPSPNVAATASTAPSVTVPTPQSPVVRPYPQDTVKSPRPSSVVGRYRVDEQNFTEVPCTTSRIASSAGGKCLLGYRGLACNQAIDVVMYDVGRLSVEATTLIFDPYKLTAIGFANRCYVAANPAYGQENFQDMNQVTRRGTNWHDLASNGEDKSIAFSDGPHNCVAVHKLGPKWRGGYLYILYASICRTDTSVVRTEDVAYALNLLQIRQDDPVANLRTAAK
jgi:DNA-binding winged helix-turn-helix (wHTH) protein